MSKLKRNNKIQLEKYTEETLDEFSIDSLAKTIARWIYTEMSKDATNPIEYSLPHGQETKIKGIS